MTDDQTTNNKLVVLFVMEKFEMPLTEDTLLSICCTENNWLRYLYCKQVLNELIKSGFVNRTTLPGNNVSLLRITSDGRSCIAYFYNELPLSLREEITAFVKNNRLEYRKKQEFVSDFFRNSDGTFTVVLKIQDLKRVLMELKLIVDSRALAVSIRNSWGETAPDMYRAIHDILLEN